MKAIIAVPATIALCYRAYSHKSLTLTGTIVAGLTATAHAIHPWNLPFVLLAAFYLAGTRVTKIKKDVKATLTEQSTGGAGGEGPRTHIQVLANSLVSTILTLLHAYQLHTRDASTTPTCYTWPGDLLVVGIIANYASVTADTFSSELGILSTSSPRLLTSLTLRKVPRGTNGGVTLWGLFAGLLGSLAIVTTSLLFLPFCHVRPDISLLRGGFEGGKAWGQKERQYFGFGMVIWGALGSVLDSFLGGWLQQSVVDTRTGRIIEGEGGAKVLISSPTSPSSMHYQKRNEVQAALEKDEDGDFSKKKEIDAKLNEKMGSPHGDGNVLGEGKAKDPTRVVESGLGLLDNNEVNFLMAVMMSLGAMGVAAWAWDVPMRSAFPF